MSDDVSGYPGAPPGWYPDPAGGPGRRWWDGYAWTDATVLPAIPPSPPPNPPAPFASPQPPPWAPSRPGYGAGAYPRALHQSPQSAQGLVADELRISSLGRLAIAFPGITWLGNLIYAVSNAARYRTFGHEFRLAMQAAQNHQVAPDVTAPDTFNTLTSLLALVAIAALVVECIWQFRAAKAARALRLPAKRSPGWGVAFWFIPVVNFWMPYQAIRDCLAPTDPNRAHVLRYWLLTVGMEIGGIAAYIGLMIATPIGVAFAVVSGVCAAGVLTSGPPVVTAIASAHRAAVSP